MSISSTNRKAGPYECNGSTVSFPFAFKVFTTADVLVVLTDADGAETDLTLGTDYSVTLNADQDANPGGSVTANTAYVTGYLVTLTSQVQNLQPVVLTNMGGFYPNIINDALDRLTIQTQQVSEQVGRAVKVNISSDVDPTALVDTLLAAEANATDAANAAAISEANASASESASATNATNAASSAAAAQIAANSVMWNDVVFKTAADSPITITSADAGKLYAIDASGGAVTVNLPTVAGLPHPFSIGIRKQDASGNAITMYPSGTDTINGAASDSLSTQNVGKVYVPDTDPNPDSWTPMTFGADLPDGAVTTPKLADAAVTLAKLAAIYGTSGANKLLQLDAAGKLPALDGSQLFNTRSFVRQTVQSGLTNAAGQPIMISAGTGLALNLAATAKPMKINFAAGLLDYSSTLTADANNIVTVLAANNTSYIYADYATPGSVNWGKKIAPWHCEYVYPQNRQALLNFDGTPGSTTMLDDFGNPWTAMGGAKLQSNWSKFGGTALGGSGANNAMNGSSDYVRSTAFTSVGAAGWAMRGRFYPTVISGSVSTALLRAANASNYGAFLYINTAGKLSVSLSGTGTSWDITSATVGTTTVTANAEHYIELTFDPLAGKYYVYLDGNLEITVTSATRLCGIADMVLGSDRTGSPAYFTGYIDAFEFLPYCDHPNGTAYTVPTTAPSISAPGYASDFYNITDSTMYQISGASTVTGSNPAMTAVVRDYTNECDTNGAGVTAVRNYALNGWYDSGLFAVVANTNYAKSHNLGTSAYTLNVTMADDAIGTNERPAGQSFSGTTGFWGGPSGRNNSSIWTGSSYVGYSTVGNGGASVTTSFYRMRAERAFR